MDEKKQKNKGKSFLDSYFVKGISFFASIASIAALFIGGFLINNKLVALQKNVQSVNINLGEKRDDTSGEVKGIDIAKAEDNSPKWEDTRGIFELNDAGYYCIKRRRNYSDQYYFLWNNNPLPLGEKNIIKLNATRNLKNNVDSQDENNSVVIVYTDPASKGPLYEMFFPASENNLVGFKIDGGLNNESIPPETIRIPFDIYKDDFEIEYGVNAINEGSNKANFNYKLTFMPDDGIGKQFSEQSSFTVPMSVNPQNNKSFILGIGVHRDGPCFKIENFN